MSDELVPFDSEIDGREIAGLFDPAISDGLSRDERLLLTALLSENERVDIAIPEDVEPERVWDMMLLCCKVFKMFGKAAVQLKLLIGRALTLIKDMPNVYESRGFSSFDDFISDEVRGLPMLTGVSRAELYKAKRIAEQIGAAVPLAEAREVGMTKMAIITGVTSPANSDFREWVEHAKSDTIPQLKERIARSNLQIPRDSMEWDMVALQVTKDEKKRLDAFLSDARVQAYCESKAPGIIISRMLDECEGEWLAATQDLAA